MLVKLDNGQIADDGFILYYRHGLIGNLGYDSGFRSTNAKCPVCKGQKKISEYRVDSITRKRCPNCQGTGEVMSKVQFQQTLSRIDEVKFIDIVNNKEYYEVVQDEHSLPKRYYNLCFRCGYVPMSKLDTNSTKYLDAHCKCGNPVTYADFTEEEIQLIIEKEIEREKYRIMYGQDLL